MEVHINQVEKRSWIEINLTQIKQNFSIYKSCLKHDSKIMAVIKADAYNHGDVEVARALSECGVSLFAVSNIDEAVGLRESGIKGEIFILGYSAVSYANTLYEYDLTQTIVSEEYAKALSQTGYAIKCQFAIDTGMNRIGLDGEDVHKCVNTIKEFSDSLKLTGIFTHLCVADSSTNEDRQFTFKQISLFKTIVDGIRDLHLPFIHCCNSAGGLFHLNEDSFYDDIGRIVRLGIILYGLKPDFSNQLPVGIEPAMEWKTQVSMVKDVHKGETIGYGRSFIVKKNAKIATITTGYADGLNRLLSNKGFVLINGQKAPIVGRICMDQTLVDITEIPNVSMGSIVTILGKNGNLEYSADDMAHDLGTIGYEVVCNISKRVQRFYF